MLTDEMAGRRHANSFTRHQVVCDYKVDNVRRGVEAWIPVYSYML